MRIKFLRSFGSIFGSHHPKSEPMNIPDDYAENWITAGYAEAVAEDTLRVDKRAYTTYTREEIINMTASEQHKFIQKNQLPVAGYKKTMKAPELEEALLAFLNYELK